MCRIIDTYVKLHAQWKTYITINVHICNTYTKKIWLVKLNNADSLVTIVTIVIGIPTIKNGCICIWFCVVYYSIVKLPLTWLRSRDVCIYTRHL